MVYPRRVVIAPDSFKGSLRAAEVATSLARGWHRERPDDEIHLLPMADGGEGTLEAFLAAVPGSRRRGIRVTGADGNVHDGAWVLLPPDADTPGGTGVIELADACGIEGLRGRLRPWDADTQGFGEAIAAALAEGVSRMILGIGSSASTDGGSGMLRALGARVWDSRGQPVVAGLGGLRDVATVDLSALPALPPAGVIVLADVDNPLCGPRGAAATFGPQKGLSADAVGEADAVLASWAQYLPAEPNAPGAGAAGGTGFALQAWGARIVAGTSYVAQLLGVPALVSPNTILVTGEGAYDAGSLSGKVPAVLCRLARDAGALAALVAGRIDPAADTASFAAALSLSDIAGSTASALAEPERHLEAAGARLAGELSAP